MDPRVGKSSGNSTDIRERFVACGSEEGDALIEFALLLPLLTLLMVGAVDFGRVFYAANAVTQAARNGVQYGARPGKSTDYTGMQNAASTAASPDLTGFAATATGFSECTDQPGTRRPPTFTCPIGTRKLTYVQVTGTYTFTTLARVPGIRSSLPISRTAIAQVP